MSDTNPIVGPAGRRLQCRKCGRRYDISEAHICPVTAPRDVGARWREAREREDEQLDVLRDAEQMWGSTNDFRCLERARDEEGNLAAARRATDEALIEATVRLILGCGPERRRHFINESNFQAGAAAILGELEKNE